MTSKHFDLEALSAYLDGEVGAEVRSGIEQHLVGCADCAASTRRLRSAASSLSSLGPVQMTVDEHRALRQAVLGAVQQPGRLSMPGSPKRRPGGRLQWSLAGAFAIIAVAVIGFAVLRPVASPEITAADSLTEAMAPAEGAPLNFDSDEQVERTVLALPEVAGARNRYRAEDAAGAAAFAPSANADAGRDNAVTQEAPEAMSKAAPESAQDPAAGGDSFSNRTEGTNFSDAAGQSCLAAVAATQSDPLVPLVARQATYKSSPSWLLVYATTSRPAPGKILDEIATILIDPAACASLSGEPLERSILSSSTFPAG